MVWSLFKSILIKFVCYKTKYIINLHVLKLDGENSTYMGSSTSKTSRKQPTLAPKWLDYEDLVCYTLIESKEIFKSTNDVSRSKKVWYDL